MTLYPDLCTSCALYFFSYYSNVGKNVFIFYFILFIYLLLFHKVHIYIYSLAISSPSIFPHWKSLKETHLYLDTTSTVYFVMDQSNQLWPVPLRQPLQPESSCRFLCLDFGDGIGSASDLLLSRFLIKWMVFQLLPRWLHHMQHFPCLHVLNSSFFPFLLMDFRGIISCLLLPYRAMLLMLLGDLRHIRKERLTSLFRSMTVEIGNSLTQH